MQARFVTELAEGARVNSTYTVRSRELRTARSGDAYLVLRLADRTGEIPAIHFRPKSDATVVPVGAVVRVQGVVTTFGGRRRISVDRMSAAATWDSAELVASSTRPLEEMREEFYALVRLVGDPGLARLIRAVFADKETLRRFCTSPATDKGHHAWTSGLIEHTVSVARMCLFLADLYPLVDRDLLLAAALLHDVGMIDEVEVGSSIEVTDAGRLVGHQVEAVARIREASRRAKTASSQALQVEHAVLCHHGDAVHGSGATIEAVVLRHADALDSEAQSFVQAVSGAVQLGERWTAPDNLFGRPLLQLADSGIVPPGTSGGAENKKTA